MIKKSNVLRVSAFISFGGSMVLMITLCVISNIIYLLSEESGSWLWYLLLAFVILLTARVSALGNPFFRAASYGDGWHNIASDHPTLWKEGNGEDIHLVIITEDGCLFNGEYDAKERVFHGFDGLDFKDHEIMLWRFESDLLPFISRDRRTIIF